MKNLPKVGLATLPLFCFQKIEYPFCCWYRGPLLDPKELPELGLKIGNIVVKENVGPILKKCTDTRIRLRDEFDEQAGRYSGEEFGQEPEWNTRCNPQMMDEGQAEKEIWLHPLEDRTSLFICPT